ncbi:MAG: Acetyl-CoA synthetase (ADP-forming) alpha and beta chains, putative [uncultured Rubrobacteraceae bacterium]|uniref:Acetyl-CoA synthetase (ADP-forming) alpha and beta chains, putative n=1 Tax=uncultured Rubrobacteraceae bacterium TaxID=349277 RepID=A0A6J4QYW0_9ACTN|nr:MAG: Acetyl-CoA synthetase (ADP-forming) alpha and beta chains, putative [uncultured Rubrobacteraceae bacterium]
MAANEALRAMLEARSVAMVGASPKFDTPGNHMVKQLIIGGFSGEVAAVNPRYDEVEGIACYPSLGEVPFVPDLVLLGVGNRRLGRQMEEAADRGVRGVVVFASGLEDPPDDPPLTERLRCIAAEAGMAVCGANCMGFANVERGLRALAFEERADLEPGNVAWISHSGSAFSALLHAERGIRFNLAVSTGQELTTTMADYMLYALERESTRVISLFLETVRDPEGFRLALQTAAERDVSVVALKVGRTPTSRRLVTAHSGALAGDDAAYEALFDAYGVARVGTLNEMADLVELLGAGRRAASGGLAAILDSGGERAHLVDAAADLAVPLARPSKETLQSVASRLEPGLPAVNPLDAWGTDNDPYNIFLDCSRYLADDQATGAFAYVVDLHSDRAERGHAWAAERVWASTDKPFAVVCGVTSAIQDSAAAHLRTLGIPVLEDVASGLRAFLRLFERRDASALPPPTPLDPVPQETVRRWREVLAAGEHLGGASALEMLADYGVPVARTVAAADLPGVLAAAKRLGCPVALKTLAASHKTEVAGVKLGLGDETALAAAYREMSSRLGPAVTVQEMVEPGVEMALGVAHDLQFGPLVMVAAGGVLIETLGDRRLGLPPLDEVRAAKLIDRLAARPLLDGVRGAPPANVDALSRALSRLSLLAMDLGDLICAVDVNPIVVGPYGCAAVDALVEPRAISKQKAES